MRDKNEVSINLNIYQKDNKVKTYKKLMNENELIMLRSDLSKEKTRDKIKNMIKMFKEIRSLTKTTK